VDEAHDRFKGRALADPVAAEQPYYLPHSDFERDPVQDMALAVIGVDLLDFDEWLDRSTARGHVFR
jgi:hypothetical protein